MYELQPCFLGLSLFTCEVFYHYRFAQDFRRRLWFRKLRNFPGKTYAILSKKLINVNM